MHDPKKVRKAISVVFSLLILGFLCIMVLLNFSTYRQIQVGDQMPPIPYYSLNGFQEFTQSDSMNTMLMIFHTDCEHCEYELRLLNKEFDRLSTSQLMFLTFDEAFDMNRSQRLWPNLFSHGHGNWGISKKDSLKKYLGPFGLPAFYFFDRSGRLENRIIGEIKFSKLMAYLND